MLKVKNKLVGKIKTKSKLKGKLNNAVVYVEPELEDLEVTPTKEQQIFKHENSYGYDEITINPIPEEYIIPDGMLEITENITYDVTPYSRVNARVYPTPNLQDKNITITENGTHNIKADEEYDGLKQVDITINVESGGSGEETSITSLNELEQKLVSVAQSHIDYLFDNVNTYETYTTEPITLYTPSATNMYYVIRKRGDNQYAIIWFPKVTLKYYSSLNINPCHLKCDTFSLLSPKDTTNDFVTYYAESYTGYYSTNFSSIEECITALQKPNTTYSQTSNNSWGSYMEGNYLVPYTNLPCIKDNVLIQSRRISSNETIEVI